jgi:hypothetical protein
MNKPFVFLLITISLFISLGLNSNTKARKNQSTFNNPMATLTPKPKSSAEIQSVALSRDEVIIPCPLPKSGIKREGSLCDDDMLINIATTASHPQNTELIYYYTISGGQIIGKGKNVTWDLNGVSEGYYSITVGIGDDTKFFDASVTKTIKVQECECCFMPCLCPSIVVSGGGDVKVGETVEFTAHTSGDETKFSYSWIISQGEIIEGQGTSKIIVKATAGMRGIIKATVKIGGNTELCNDCPRTVFETATIIQ